MSVTDPESLVTDYTYDGLDNLKELDSPDTGVTTYTYDAAGSRLSQTDARSVTVSYGYDALNRLTSITYPDTDQNVTFTYDTCTHGVGQLCEMDDESGTTAYDYDARGNLTGETTTRGTVTLKPGAVAYGQCPMRQPRASMSGMSSRSDGMKPYRFGISTSGRVFAFITSSWPMMPFL